MNQTFSKHERLKNKKAIEQLFAEGKHIKKFPIQLVYMKNKEETKTIKVAFAVPKKKIKLAVYRNRIKRLLREVYRKNKDLFYKNLVNSHHFIFIYTANYEIPYHKMETIIKQIGVEFYKKNEK